MSWTTTKIFHFIDTRGQIFFGSYGNFFFFFLYAVCHLLFKHNLLQKILFRSIFSCFFFSKVLLFPMLFLLKIKLWCALILFLFWELLCLLFLFQLRTIWMKKIEYNLKSLMVFYSLHKFLIIFHIKIILFCSFLLFFRSS